MITSNTPASATIGKATGSIANIRVLLPDQRAIVIRSVFEDAYNCMKSGQLIRQVINKIQESIDFNKYPYTGNRRPVYGFASRKQSEFAWKVDFKTIKADAEKRAQPHRDKEADYKQRASRLESSVKQLKEDLKTVANTQTKATLNEQIKQQTKEAKSLKAKADTEKKAADAIYWPIYNLDIDNPHIGEQVSHDPDELLSQYAAQQQEMAETRRLLKDILAQALSGESEKEAE